MALAILHSHALAGITTPSVAVEMRLTNDRPSFHIEILSKPEEKESRDRVPASLLTSRCGFPVRRFSVKRSPILPPKENGR